MRNLKFSILALIVVIFFSCEDNNNENYQPTFSKTNPSLSTQESSQTNAKKKGDKKFLLVHGAWHPEGSWNKMVVGLEKFGHEVHTIQLPGLGTDRTPISQITLATHVNAVTSKMQEIGSGITLVGHSYGGVVISQAAENLSSYVDQVVYVSAFMLNDGQSLFDIAATDLNSVVTQNIVITGDSVFIPEDAYENAFYNYGQNSNNKNIDEDIYFIKTLLVPQPLATFTTPISLSSAYNNLDKVYISCTDDRAITPQAQQNMYSNYPDVQVYTIQNADHSPFLSRPNQLLNILKGL
ncbi:alpha/beta hydrolase [Fulvivirga maritima]|uniref:alpha/beta fold hydrolase n=1 Tax=Fulvivirga maritima TaxID=2904247 RepID=UPI001F1D00E8|nr:alpha/beta fold hydrolase [Fulvivirga maritima]UII27412.1 alpha/beta hydrolase [Fulvivirga maritima]